MLDANDRAVQADSNGGTFFVQPLVSQARSDDGFMVLLAVERTRDDSLAQQSSHARPAVREVKRVRRFLEAAIEIQAEPVETGRPRNAATSAGTVSTRMLLR